MVTATSKFHRLILLVMTGAPLAFLAPACSSSSDGSPSGTSDGGGADSPDNGRPEPKYRLFAGDDTACVKLADGSLKCWGANGGGQLGLGAWDRDVHSEPKDAVPGVVATEVAVYSQVCAITPEGVKCWGFNNRGGQTGQPSENTTETCNSDGPGALACTKTPSLVAGVNGATRLAVGSGFSCAQTSSNVVCWGGDLGGILGRKDPMPFYDNPPNAIPFDKADDITALVAGERFACVRKGSAGSVWCWGEADYGQIGVAPGAPSGPTWNGDRHFIPQQVDGLSQTRALAAGYEFACAVLADKTVSCWGRNGSVDKDGVWSGGQLGHAREKDEQCGAGTLKHPCNGRPTKVEGIQNARELALGEEHACALLEDDTVMCWGYPGSGRIGLERDAGGGDAHPEPVKVPQLSNVAHIAAGRSFSCAVTWDSKVSCWGSAFFGVVSPRNSAVPRPVPGLD